MKRKTKKKDNVIKGDKLSIDFKTGLSKMKDLIQRKS